MPNIRTFAPTAAPDLKSVLDAFQYDTIRAINCCLVGKVVSFNAAKNTVSVKIQGKTPLANGKTQEYPILEDCPAFILSGGLSHLFMPITKDDPCLVIFNDRDIDAWWLSGTDATPTSNRAHSLSDGFALVGVRPATSPLSLASDPGIYSTDKRATISGLGAAVDGTLGKVKIKNSAASLATVLSSGLTPLSTDPALSSGTTAALSTMLSNLALLLEA